MASNSHAQSALINPESSIEGSVRSGRASSYRHPTVYDAVAGRISTAGFIPKNVVIASSRDTASSSTAPIPPEAVLFRGKAAPTRYEEYDIYFETERRHLPDLPESDLLKALHSYTADFYSRATLDGGVTDWKSLDETALLALGILMEEASREILGKTGNLVFTEGEEVTDNSHHQSAGQRVQPEGRPAKKRRIDLDD